MAVSIYDYENYVRFLNDWFKEEKSKNKKFSHQFFAQTAGFKSRSFMANILNGSRALNPKYIFKVAMGLKLQSKETKYFEALVYYKESKDLKEKDFHFKLAQKLKPRTKINKIKSMQQEYFQKWYYPVLRELLTYFDYKDDYKLLGQQLTPSITETEAKKAVRLLLELELIRKKVVQKKDASIVHNKKNVFYEQTDNVVFGDDDDYSEAMAIRNFQEVTIELAKTALRETPRSETNFLTYTFSTNKEGVKEVNEIINEFQDKLITVVGEHKKLDSTLQLNIQFFPLTEITKE